jgi:anaerobic ribonucleoside-triphosphate reductase activating protein
MELTIIIDGRTGAVLVEGPERVAPETLDCLRDEFGRGREIACATPATMRTAAAASPHEATSEPCIRIAGYYHDSLIEGPGRRSVVKVQGCATHCRRCITPDSWSFHGGALVPVSRLVQALLDPAFERDGITVVGGEPFAQPEGLWVLVQELRARGCRHILVYSGYTYEWLRRTAEREPAIGAVLDTIDILIDGPYVAALADGAGPWIGSGNQRVIDLAATIRIDRVSLLSEVTKPE